MAMATLAIAGNTGLAAHVPFVSLGHGSQEMLAGSIVTQKMRGKYTDYLHLVMACHCLSHSTHHNGFLMERKRVPSLFLNKEMASPFLGLIKV